MATGSRNGRVDGVASRLPESLTATPEKTKAGASLSSPPSQFRSHPWPPGRPCLGSGFFHAHHPESQKLHPRLNHHHCSGPRRASILELSWRYQAQSPSAQFTAPLTLSSTTLSHGPPLSFPLHYQIQQHHPHSPICGTYISFTLPATLSLSHTLPSASSSPPHSNPFLFFPRETPPYNF